MVFALDRLRGLAFGVISITSEAQKPRPYIKPVQFRAVLDRLYVGIENHLTYSDKYKLEYIEHNSMLLDS